MNILDFWCKKVDILVLKVAVLEGGLVGEVGEVLGDLPEFEDEDCPLLWGCVVLTIVKKFDEVCDEG